jgi:hypothetical protein
MLIQQHVGNALLNRILAIALAAHEGALLHVHLTKASEIRGLWRNFEKEDGFMNFSGSHMAKGRSNQRQKKTSCRDANQQERNHTRNTQHTGTDRTQQHKVDII